MDITYCSDREVIDLYSNVISELKKRGIIQTNNIIRDLGRHLAIDCYNSSTELPQLSATPVGSESFDAISENGNRYSIKSTTTNTTGGFYRLESKGSERKDSKQFEFVLICKFNADYSLEMILELTWEQFIKYRKWNSRASVWNLFVTKELINSGVIVYSV